MTAEGSAIGEPLALGGGLIPGEQIACLVVPALPRSAGWARRQVTAALSAWDVPADVVQSAEMVVAELASNAVRVTSRGHSGRDVACAPRISVALRLLPGQVVIEVTDSDPSPPALAEAGLGAENGRGLVIVQNLSDKWGYDAQSSGKVVFAMLSTSGPETAGHPQLPGQLPARAPSEKRALSDAQGELQPDQPEGKADAFSIDG